MQELGEKIPLLPTLRELGLYLSEYSCICGIEYLKLYFKVIIIYCS